MMKGMIIIALIGLAGGAYGQGIGAASRNRVNPYGSPEVVNPSLVKGFEDYRYLVDYNIFSSKRGVLEVKKDDVLPKSTTPPPPPPPPEKRFVLTGVAREGEQFLAYIEVNNDNSKYISPVGVNDRIGSGIGVVTSIDLDGIEYRKSGSDSEIRISVGYDLTGEPAGSGMKSAITSVVSGTIEEMMKARRKAMESGYDVPGVPVPAPLPAVQPPSRIPNQVPRPGGGSYEDFLRTRGSFPQGGNQP